tara:strand:+ start:381 stop:545 length:165 start_codon:yes stop_codon:yes gene_type:complete
MEKLTERLSFRTSEENVKYLKTLADSDDRSTSYVINRMIEHFKGKSVKDIRKIK